MNFTILYGNFCGLAKTSAKFTLVQFDKNNFIHLLF